jgi:hypothetical protein
MEFKSPLFKSANDDSKCPGCGNILRDGAPYCPTCEARREFNQTHGKSAAPGVHVVTPPPPTSLGSPKPPVITPTAEGIAKWLRAHGYEEENLPYAHELRGDLMSFHKFGGEPEPGRHIYIEIALKKPEGTYHDSKPGEPVDFEMRGDVDEAYLRYEIKGRESEHKISFAGLAKWLLKNDPDSNHRYASASFEKEACWRCDGTGEIKAPSGLKRSCPTCKGDGKIYKPTTSSKRTAAPVSPHVLEDTVESPDADHINDQEIDSNSELGQAKAIAEKAGYTWNGLYNAEDESDAMYSMTGNGDVLYLSPTEVQGNTSVQGGLNWFFENSKEEGNGLEGLKELLLGSEVNNEEEDKSSNAMTYADKLWQKIEQRIGDVSYEVEQAYGEDTSAKDAVRDLVSDALHDAFGRDWQHNAFAKEVDEWIMDIYVDPMFEDDDSGSGYEDEPQASEEQYQDAAEGILQIIRENKATNHRVDAQSYVHDMAEAVGPGQPKMNADLLYDYVQKLLAKEGIKE